MELDARKQRILQAIVDDYVATAEPVGSQVLLARHTALGVKSATIRNEMAEMSEQGYLRQPHTSAGRVPADRGYRFYVNRLMPLSLLPNDEALHWQQAAQQASQEMDAILRRTCQLLAAMTRLPALAVAPSHKEATLQQVFVSPAGAEKTLLVLLFSGGQVENRVVAQPRLSHSDALFLASSLNDRLAGQTLHELADLDTTEFAAPNELGALRLVWKVLAGEIVLAARSLSARLPVYVEGENSLVEQPEFREMERLQRLLTTLQEGAAVAEMLQTNGGDGQTADDLRASSNRTSRYPVSVSVRIGSENPQPELADCTLVMSRYYIGDRQSGAIGVVGPTRMNYRHTTAAVALMARTMGDLLTRLSFSS